MLHAESVTRELSKGGFDNACQLVRGSGHSSRHSSIKARRQSRISHRGVREDNVAIGNRQGQSTDVVKVIVGPSSAGVTVVLNLQTNKDGTRWHRERKLEELPGVSCDIRKGDSARHQFGGKHVDELQVQMPGGYHIKQSTLPPMIVEQLVREVLLNEHVVDGSRAASQARSRCLGGAGSLNPAALREVPFQLSFLTLRASPGRPYAARPARDR